MSRRIYGSLNNNDTNYNNYIAIESPSIANVERAHVCIFGSVVVLDLAFVTSQVIPQNTNNNTAVFFSGFPKTIAGAQRFRIPSINSNQTILILGIFDDGTIRNQWTIGDIPVGSYQGQVVYIADTSDTRYF